MSSLPVDLTVPWHHFLTIDLLFRVAGYTILHPFVAWIVVLCLRAQATAWTATSMYVAIGYASLLTLYHLLEVLNRRIAYGRPRSVDLSEEVIVITGGASGLGLLLAEVYGMRGASVAVLDIKELDLWDETGIESYKCDVGDRDQVLQTAKRIVQDLGKPTILINNAGVVSGKPLLELSPRDLDRNFRVNLLAHFHTIQAFLPDMLVNKKGTIVTISSVLGHLGCKNLSDYTASKAGLLAMHSSLTAEIPPDSNVKTLLVAPGHISTTLFTGVKTPNNFFGPVLEPVEVAKEIIAAVDSGISGDLAMPLYARWIQVFGVLPKGIQALLRWLVAWDRAMDGFVGYEKEREQMTGNIDRDTKAPQVKKRLLRTYSNI